MNRSLGMISSVATFLAAAAFVIAAATKSGDAEGVWSILMSLGFLPLICSFAAHGRKDQQSFKFTAIGFCIVYVMFTSLIGFMGLAAGRLIKWQITDNTITGITKLGRDYSLIADGFMMLAAFFIGFMIYGKKAADIWLKKLLMIQGLWAIPCFVLPFYHVFSEKSISDTVIRIIEIIPVGVMTGVISLLSYQYFKNQIRVYQKTVRESGKQGWFM
ncbi:MAG: hypothetical protein E7256_04850 [Lachnospiraceae bacterium]|nr:hypothetical protein [Lachnospiraceae bacterium]